MNVREFYETIGGDYDTTIGNLMKEDRIIKYLNKFLKMEDFNKFGETFESGQFEDAFRYAHNLKGMSLTLGMSKLGGTSAVVCDALRNGAPSKDLSEEISAMNEDYRYTVEKIKELVGEA